MEYLKNPIILGLLTSGICFLYLKWNENKAVEDGVPEELIEKANMKYPVILGIIVFLGMSIWENYQKNIKLPSGSSSIKIPIDIMSLSPQAKLPLINDALPHVFIETSP